MRNLMEAHGLTRLGWTCVFDERPVSRFGQCRTIEKQIGLSLKLVVLNNEDAVRDTILHEIAHALDTVRHGRHSGHGPRWKAICREIGANPRCYYSESVVTPVTKPRKLSPIRIGRCQRCATEYPRRRVMATSCGKCSKTYDPTNLLIWS